MLSNVQRDIRLAVRRLRRTPIFTVVAVAALALGIGANTAVFSVLRTLVLAPLPYPGLDRLVAIHRTQARRGIEYSPAAPADVVDYRSASGFEDVVAVAGIDVVMSGDATESADEAQTERLRGAQVTPGFFATLGVSPVLGRVFTSEDRQTEDLWPPVIVSHGFWARRFGSDPNVIGRGLRIGKRSTIVVGVLPEGFRFPLSKLAGLSTETPDVWFPNQIDPGNTNRENAYLYTFGRLKPGVSVSQANEQIKAISQHQREQFPEYRAAGTDAYVTPLQQDAGAAVRPMLFALFGAVAFVLLIACANVANLLLVRASGRTREVAVCTALGASRGDIVRELLAEAGVLAVLGGGIGVALAGVALPALARLVPPDLPRVGPLALDGTVLGYSVLATMVSALAFGLYPALAESRADFVGAMRLQATGRRSARHAMRSRLVVVEIALSFILVMGAGLMLRSLVTLRSTDPGFRPDGVLMFQATLPPGIFHSTDERIDMKRRVQEVLQAIPGVRHVGAASSAPLAGDRTEVAYANELTAGGGEAGFREAWFRRTLPGYFQAVGTPLMEGRTFSQADQSDSTNYVVVDERLARANWPGQSAIGKRLFVMIGGSPSWFEVIGVVRDQNQISLAPETQETIWFSDRTFGGPTVDVWEVRAAGDPTALVGAVRAAISSVDSRILVESVRPLAAQLSRAEAPTALVLKIASVFAALALLLAVIGLYGVVAYVVRERTGEFGLRMALGSDRESIFRLVLRHGALLAAVGVGGGALGSLLLTRAMASMLVGVSPYDPLTLLAVAVVFGAVTLAACFAPARRAVGVDPAVALRAE